MLAYTVWMICVYSIIDQYESNPSSISQIKRKSFTMLFLFVRVSVPHLCNHKSKHIVKVYTKSQDRYARTFVIRA